MAKNVSAPSGTPSFFTEVSRACGYGGRGERLVSLTQLCPWGRHRRTQLIHPQPRVDLAWVAKGRTSSDSCPACRPVQTATGRWLVQAAETKTTAQSFLELWPHSCQQPGR